MFKALIPFASKIIKDAVKKLPDDAISGDRIIELCLTILAKAVKSTKTDVDDQLFQQVATAIRKREVKADDFVS